MKAPRKSSQTVRRGKATRPRRTSRQPARAATLWQRLLAAQPFPPSVVRKGAVALFAIMMVGAAATVATLTGVTAFARAELIGAIGRAGFTVQRIEVVGANRLDRLRVYDIALAQKDRSMAAFDLAEVRDDLKRYGWVGDARVSRRLPDTLVINLVERSPAAVWQDNGRHVLIDADGARLPGVDPASIPALPVLVGADPALQMPAFTALLEAAPALRPQVAGGAWVGDRRWNISFKTGEQLLLPEDAVRARDAFAEFARMDGVNRLLGRGVTRFDMRMDGRLVFRPGREGDLGDLGLISGSDRSVEPAAAPRDARQGR